MSVVIKKTSVETLCPFCGNKQADVQTGRCLSCGKRVASPDIASEFGHPVMDRSLGVSRPSPSADYRANGIEKPAAESSAVAERPPVLQPVPSVLQPVPSAEAAPAESPPLAQPLGPAVFTLPNSRTTDKWLSQGRTMRDKLLAQADKAEAQIEELRMGAARCRETAEAFSHLLDQLAAKGEPQSEKTTSGSKPGPKPAGKWSHAYDACIDCGTVQRKHCANGRCRPCDDRWRHPRTTG